MQWKHAKVMLLMMIEETRKGEKEKKVAVY
jgi:hypothetical protein